MMIGRQLAGMEREQIALGEPVLKVKDLTVIGDRNKAEVNGLSFELRRGEILGIAGVEGNGQTELSECILGIRRAMQGSVEICGTDVTKASVNARIEKGLAFITTNARNPYDGKPYRRLRLDVMAEEKLTRAQKAKLRFTRRVEASLLDEAVGALSDAKKAHDALESAYHPCVDFEGATALAEKEIKRLLKQ